MIPKLTNEPGALETAVAIRAGELLPLEAIDAAINRIVVTDGKINAVVVRDFERARDAAKSFDGKAPGPDQPLFGVPMTIKESFDIAGLPTTWGLAEHKDFIAKSDAVVVQRLKRAGAIFLGKTNVPPRLSDWQSNNPNYGRTNNPHDLTRSPGGSSGGSAAALAAGMVPAEFGSDIAGSVRVPAHFCGVWGHKPTWNAIDSAGHYYPGTEGHTRALAVVGPLARSGADLATLLELTLDRPQQLSGKQIGDGRFLVIEQHPLTVTDDEMSAAISATASAIEATGARVDRESDMLPDLAAMHGAYFPMLLTAMDPFGPNPQTGKPTLLTEWFAFLDAQARFRRIWDRLFEVYDFVLAPPFVTPAFPHDEKPTEERTVDVNGKPLPAVVGMCWPGVATFPELPATVLPVGQSGGLPVGLQVIGGRWRDRDCVATATAIGELIGV